MQVDETNEFDRKVAACYSVFILKIEN